MFAEDPAAAGFTSVSIHCEQSTNAGAVSNPSTVVDSREVYSRERRRFNRNERIGQSSISCLGPGPFPLAIVPLLRRQRVSADAHRDAMGCFGINCRIPSVALTQNMTVRRVSRSDAGLGTRKAIRLPSAGTE